MCYDLLTFLPGHLLPALLWFSPGQQQRTTWSLSRSSHRWAGEENQNKEAKLMGRDKDSLTGGQRK